MSHIRNHRQTEEKLQGLAKQIQGELPEGILFALVCFSGGQEGGYASYVSNADRTDMVRALYEAADRMATKSDSGPFAEVEELEARRSRQQRRREERERRKRK